MNLVLSAIVTAAMLTFLFSFVAFVLLESSGVKVRWAVAAFLSFLVAAVAAQLVR